MEVSRVQKDLLVELGDKISEVANICIKGCKVVSQAIIPYLLYFCEYHVLCYLEFDFVRALHIYLFYCWCTYFYALWCHWNGYRYSSQF